MRVLVVALALVGCRINFDEVCGLEGPCITRVSINSGATYARGPRLSTTVQVSGSAPPFEVRVSENCEFVDDGWQPLDAPHWTIVEPVDGDKKLCAWARDATGAVSSAREAIGINADTIKYEAENVPVVEDLDIVALDASTVRLTWTVSDVEGLAAIDLDYVTDSITRGSWSPLVSGHAMTGTRAQGMIDLPLPTTQPFVVRLVPIDRAGNRGIAATSDVVNAPGWRIYMGSRDRGVGGAAKAARLVFAQNTTYQMAIDPNTHDVYAEDRDFGIVKLDAATGDVERFLLTADPSNLPDDGPLTADSGVPNNTQMRFGPDGKLYVSPGDGDSDTVSGVIYQIDPQTRHCRRYVGGGTANNASATPSTVFVFKWLFAFDERGTLYFLTSCTPGVDTALPRLLKVTQNADGSAGTVSVVAGNCAAGSVPLGGPYDPLATPFPPVQYRGIGSIAAFNEGRSIYWAFFPGDVWKVVDGQLYSSTISTGNTGSLAYDRSTNTLYTAKDGSIEMWRPGQTDDTALGTHAYGNTGVGDCTRDGASVVDACVSAAWTIEPTAHGVYFVDGSRLNQDMPYRVRFIDRAGAVRTYLGTPGLTGDGFDRQVVRGRMSGIAYKSPAAPNQQAFPAGLYFVDAYAMRFGYVDATTDRMSILWGNGSNSEIHHTTGAPMSRDVSLGVAYGGGNLEPFTFDAMGLPWLRYGSGETTSYLVTLDGARNVVDVQSGSAYWELAADGSDPRLVDIWPYGAVTNLTLKNRAAFFVGGYLDASPTATIRMLDFGANTTTRLMGAGTNGFTADRPTQGTVTTASLSGACMNNASNCFAQYHAAQDRLYFTEGSRLRFITDPSTPALSTLQTLYTDPGGNSIYNFTFRPDGSQVFIGGGSQVRCVDVTSGAPWCNGLNFGPPPVLGVVGRGPNQFTWKDNNTLLISTYQGAVLEYTLP